jgi:biopolymer transport protein ExbB
MGFSVRHDPTRLATFVLFSVLALFTVAFVLPALQSAHAQDAAAEGEGGGGESREASQSILSHMFHAITRAGFVGIIVFLVLIVISVGMVALVVLLAMDLRLSVAIPPGFLEEYTDTVNKRRFKEAFELAKNENSFLARVLTAGMGRLQYGLDDAREVILNTVDSIKAGKEHLIAYLATAGTLGPLIGLVGTVYGMILSFMELSRPGAVPRADRLADGISHALVITLLGVAVSVPAIFCHAFFRSRLIRLSMDVSNIADDLLTQMYHNSRKPAAAPTPPQQPAAAALKPAQG